MDTPKGLPVPHTDLAIVGLLYQLQIFVQHFASVRPHTQKAQKGIEKEAIMHHYEPLRFRFKQYLSCVFVRKAPPQLNEWGCLQWNLGTPQEDGVLPVAGS